MPEDQRWLTMKEICDYLQVSEDTIGRWLAGKGMPGSKVGRAWRFKRSEVDAWVRAGGAAADTPQGRSQTTGCRK